MRTWLAIAAMVLAVSSAGASEFKLIRLKVTAGASDCTETPVCAVIDIAGLKDSAVTLKRVGASVPGQIVPLEDGKAELWWILPGIKVGESQEWTAITSKSIRAKAFSFKDTPGETLDLMLGDRAVTRYMYAYDQSTPERAHETYKVYHHVFDAAGENVITKGQGGKYTHHRGIFTGWNKLTFEGEQFDLWHMKEVEMTHQKHLELVGGPVLGRSTALIHWNDKNDKAIVSEERTITVYRQEAPNIVLLDFNNRLTALRGDVDLNGDPEHAGVQYRPHNQVAERAADKETAVLYRFNTENPNLKTEKDLPWAAMAYTLDDKRYSVQHMNHPDNPKDTLYSAYRDYGRFGAFFKTTIKKGETLELRYRIRVDERAMPSTDALNRAAAEFVDAPKVVVEIMKDNYSM